MKQPPAFKGQYFVIPNVHFNSKLTFSKQASAFNSHSTLALNFLKLIWLYLIVRSVRQMDIRYINLRNGNDTVKSLKFMGYKLCVITFVDIFMFSYTGAKMNFENITF